MDALFLLALPPELLMLSLKGAQYTMGLTTLPSCRRLWLRASILEYHLMAALVKEATGPQLMTGNISLGVLNWFIPGQ